MKNVLLDKDIILPSDAISKDKYGGGGFAGELFFLLNFRDRDQISQWAYEALALMSAPF